MGTLQDSRRITRFPCPILSEIFDPVGDCLRKSFVARVSIVASTERKRSYSRAMAGQRYRELVKSIQDTAKETAGVRKEWLDNVNAKHTETEPMIQKK
jgi:hypothetical protein